MSEREALELAGRLHTEAPGRRPQPIDFAARFTGLSSDVLFAVEEQHGEPEDARDYIEHLLVILADWRSRLLEGSRADAGDYRRCLDTVREAWLQYSFRWAGGPDLPYPFDLPKVGVAR